MEGEFRIPLEVRAMKSYDYIQLKEKDLFLLMPFFAFNIKFVHSDNEEGKAKNIKRLHDRCDALFQWVRDSQQEGKLGKDTAALLLEAFKNVFEAYDRSNPEIVEEVRKMKDESMDFPIASALLRLKEVETQLQKQSTQLQKQSTQLQEQSTQLQGVRNLASSLEDGATITLTKEALLKLLESPPSKDAEVPSAYRPLCIDSLERISADKPSGVCGEKEALPSGRASFR